MIDIILEKFTEISKKCLDKQSKELGVDKKNVQLIFKLNLKDEVEYLITENCKPKKVLTFLEVLGVRIDFKGYSLFVPKFIHGALHRFCKEGIQPDKVSVMLFCGNSDKLIMWVYNGSTPVKQITLQSLFNEEDVIIE
jgi:hypothetical protein